MVAALRLSCLVRKAIVRSDPASTITIEGYGAEGVSTVCHGHAFPSCRLLCPHSWKLVDKRIEAAVITEEYIEVYLLCRNGYHVALNATCPPSTFRLLSGSPGHPVSLPNREIQHIDCLFKFNGTLDTTDEEIGWQARRHEPFILTGRDYSKLRGRSAVPFSISVSVRA